jgi:hypothetical protein
MSSFVFNSSFISEVLKLCHVNMKLILNCIFVYLKRSQCEPEILLRVQVLQLFMLFPLLNCYKNTTCFTKALSTDHSNDIHCCIETTLSNVCLVTDNFVSVNKYSMTRRVKK